MNKTLDTLTERELEILRWVAEGLSNGEIAEKLFLSLGTVKWYNGQIFAKLGVKNRTQAIVRGRELGLLHHESPESVASIDHNLPAHPTPFVGRQEELARLQTLLHECRLLTLVGPGGIGKTRIALEAAQAQLALPHFPDGVYFVALAPLSSPEHIVSMIGAAMNLTFNDQPRLQLLEHLRTRRMLLVLDNFDELLDGVGLVTDILQAAPGVKALVTSRERLNVQEETLFRVEGMADGAVQLFIQSSRRLRPDMPFTDADLHSVTRICRLVEGMPLGIVLAAAWVEMLSPDEIADEIARSFDFLETDMRNMPPRHRSVRVVFESAWNMLTDVERASFARLAAFRGGFTRCGAQDVARATLPTLMALVNKSLLRRDPDHTHRYEIHELLRQYAAEQLEKIDQGEETRRAHSQHYLGLLWPDVTSDDDDLEADFENIRAAWNWAVEHDQQAALGNALDSLYDFCTRRSRHWDALQMFDYAITVASRSTDQNTDVAHTLLRLRECRGKLRQLTGDFIGAVADLQHVRYAAHASGDALWERDLLIRLGQLYRKREQHNEATHYLDKVVQFSRRNGNLRGVADALYHLGTVAWDEGDNTQSRLYHQEAVDIVQQLGLRDVVAVQAYHGLGESLMMSAQPVESIAHYHQSMHLARQIGDISYISENLQMIGWTRLGMVGTGEYREAHDAFIESLPMTLAAHLDWHSICNYIGLGLAQGSLGQYGQGIASIQTGLKIAESLGIVRFICLGLDSLGQLYQDLNALDKAKAAHAKVVDLMLKNESTYWLARAQANHAIERIRQGDLDVEAELLAALEVAYSRGQEFHALRALEGLTELGIARREPVFAQKYADALLSLGQTRGLHEMCAQAHHWRGEAFMLTGQLEDAQAELLQAAAIATRIERVRLVCDTHTALARYAEMSGNDALAQRHRQIAHNAVQRMADSLVGHDHDEALRLGLMALL